MDQGLSIASVIATFCAVGALLFAGIQLDLSRKLATAQLLLEIDDQLRDYDSVFEGLSRESNKINDFEVRRAMGALERLNLLLDDRLIDVSTIRDFHGWRFKVLFKNENARGRMSAYPESWSNLLALAKKLELD